jgi:hypothetical protein
LEAAAYPVRYRDLADKLAAEFPPVNRAQISKSLNELLIHRVLLSAFRSPSTVTDPLGRILAVLDTAAAAEIPSAAPLSAGLLGVRDALAGLADAESPMARRSHRGAVRELMRSAAPGVEARITTDLRLNGSVTLPEAVAVEMELAASALARLAVHPLGTPAWRDYTARFADRYSHAALVGVMELTDPDVGLGLPAGFLHSGSEPAPPLTDRDRKLLAVAGQAAIEGARHIKLSEPVLRELEDASGPARLLPPHLELHAQVIAGSVEALDRGDFRVRVLTASRAAGTMSGRFLHLLDADDQRRMTQAFAGLPTLDPDASMAQLSFPPSRTDADAVARCAPILPLTISLGEHRRRGDTVFTADDLVVGLADGRLFLATRADNRALEPLTPTALNFRTAVNTPPLARFIAEISRSGCAQATGFDWGAALALPFTPALHLGRSILIPARWRLRADELPGPTESFGTWTAKLREWRGRRGMPERVMLTEADQHLLLDVGLDGHADQLRTHLAKAGRAVLIDAPPADGNGWFDGRAHSLVVPMAKATNAEERR